MSAARPPDPGHLTALEGLRGLAAVWVLLFHCSVRTGSEPVGPGPLAHVIASGSLGVDVFFVLSGCVLTLRPLRDGGVAPGWSGRFVLRRAARLLPAAWFALALAVLTAPLTVADPGAVRDSITPESVAANATLLGGLARLVPGYDGAIGFVADPVVWSLTPEVLFSLALVPIVAWLFTRPLALAGTALAAGVGLRALDPSPEVLSVLGPLTTAFPAGILAALAIVRGGQWLRLAPAAGLTALAAVILTRDPGDLLQIKEAAASGVVIPLLVAGGAALLVAGLGALPDAPPARLAGSAPLRALGRWSYGIYLLHFPLIGMLVWTAGLPRDGSGRAFLLAAACTLPLSVAAGAASHRWLEQPARRWAAGARRTAPRGGHADVLRTPAG